MADQKVSATASGDLHGNVSALQMLRAVAALLVVFWHSELVIKYMKHNYWLGGSDDFRAAHYPSFLNHLDLGVDIFFCISGYIMALLVFRVAPGVGWGGLPAKDFIAKRAIRVFPPYWVFTAFVVIVFYISNQKMNVGQMSGNHMDDARRILTSLVLLPQPVPPVLGVGWTLVYEAQFYIFCALIVWAGLQKRFLELLFLSFLIGVVFEYRKCHVGYGYIFSTFHIEFFFGALVFKHEKYLIDKRPLIQLAAAMATFILLSIALDSLRPVDGIAFSMVRKCVGGLLGALLISSLIGLDRRYRISKNVAGRLFVRIGNASYTLYLAHWFILSPMGRLLSKFPELPAAAVVILHLGAVSICVAVCVVLAERIELPFHKYLSHRWARRRYSDRTASVHANAAATGRD